jgi:hypothetical protein
MNTINKPTGLDGLALLDFPVAKVPVYLALGKEIPNHRAVVRPDTGAVLGLVGDGYELVTHKQSYEPYLEKLGKEGWRVHTVKVERDGAKSYIELHNTVETREVRAGDTVGQRLLLWNTYDGTTGVGAAFSQVVTWCLNGATVSEKTWSAALRHTGGVFDRLNAAANETQSQFGRAIALYRGLAETSVSPEIAKTVIAEVCGIKKLDLVKHHWTNIGHLGDKGPSAWNLYNAITYYLTHQWGGSIATREAKNREAIDLITHPEKVRELIEAEKREKALSN